MADQDVPGATGDGLSKGKGPSNPVDDALAAFSSALSALSTPGEADKPKPAPASSPVPELPSFLKSTRPTSDSASASSPTPGRTPGSSTRRPVDDALTTFQATLASLSEPSSSSRTRPSTPAPTTPPELPDFLRNAGKPRVPGASAGSPLGTPSPGVSPSASSAASSAEDFLARLKAMQVPVSTPTPTPSADAELPEFLRKARSRAKAPTPKPVTAEPVAPEPVEPKPAEPVVPVTDTTPAQPLERPVFTRTPRVRPQKPAPEKAAETPAEPVKPEASTANLERPVFSRSPRVTPAAQPAPVEPPAAETVEPAAGPVAAPRPRTVRSRKPESTESPTIPLIAEAPQPVLPAPAAPLPAPVAALTVTPPEPVEVQAPVEVRAPVQVPEAPTAPIDFVAPEDVAPAVEVVAPEPEPVTKVRPARFGKAKTAPVAEAPVEVAEEAAPAQSDADLFALPAGDEATPVPPKRKRRLGALLWLLLPVLLIVGGLAYLGTTLYKNTHEITFTDMAGNKVVPDDPSAQDPSYIENAAVKEDVGVRFKIPSVDLDVPLGEVNQVDGLINPPGFTSVYRVRNMGVTLTDAAKGTVYAVTHSLRAPGKAPGNFVIDIPSGTVTVKNGSEIDVGDLKYTAVSSEIVAKTDLSAQANLWANTPGMLVFITCLQYESTAGYVNGHSPDNVVIIGQLVT